MSVRIWYGTAGVALLCLVSALSACGAPSPYSQRKPPSVAITTSTAPAATAPPTTSTTGPPTGIEGESMCGYAAIAHYDGIAVGLGDCVGAFGAFLDSKPIFGRPISVVIGATIVIDDFRDTDGPFTTSDPSVASITSETAMEVVIEARAVGTSAVMVQTSQCLQNDMQVTSSDCPVVIINVSS